MSDNDAARTDLYASMQHAVTADPCRTPTMRCPRCERAMDPADLSVQALGELRLSRTFEAIRDTAIEDVLGWAVWYNRRGQDAYLVVYETGAWAIQPVPRGQVYDDLDDRGYLALPIPVAPTAADRAAGDDEDAGDERAGSTLREIDVAALYRRRVPSDADHEPLEMGLATRFYRTLYGKEEIAQ